MPYVKQSWRHWVDKEINTLTVRMEKQFPEGIPSGLINYCITQILLARLYGTDRGRQPSYEDFNAVEGILGKVGRHMDNRWCEPYETLKREENGDIF